MPCSSWTTRSPAARLAASAMNSSRLRRRRGVRASRAPRMSCSPGTAGRGGLGGGAGNGRELHEGGGRKHFPPFIVADEHLLRPDRAIERRSRASARRRDALPGGVEIGDAFEPMLARLLALIVER